MSFPQFFGREITIRIESQPVLPQPSGEAGSVPIREIRGFPLPLPIPHSSFAEGFQRLLAEAFNRLQGLEHVVPDRIVIDDAESQGEFPAQRRR